MKEKRFQKIYVEITNVCNLKCKFCPDTKREKKFMRIEDFRNILNSIKPYTNLIYLHIKGEPLLHPDIENILKECDNSNIMVNITTNGTLLLDKIDILRKCKAIRQINISLHSLNQNDISKIETQKYLSNVLETVKVLNRETSILISFRLWNISEIGKNEKNLQVINTLEKEYNIENLMEKTSKSSDVKLREYVYLNQDIQFEWPNMQREEIGEKGKCFGLRNQIGILVNGDIVPCCLDQEADIKLGNIYENSIDEILESKLAKDIINGFRAHKLIHPLCRRCGFRIRFENR